MFPVDPRDLSKAVCPPYARPVVFFSPHPDDETIGMGGAIAEHVAAGRSVIVELLTRGEATPARDVLNDGASDDWHTGLHNYSLSTEELGDARVQEFLEAASALGVHGVHISDFGDADLTAAEVTTRIAYWTGRGDEGLSLAGTVGEQDLGNTGSPHADHIAVWQALSGVGHPDVRGYLVFHHSSGAGSYTDAVTLETAACTAKQSAINAYKRWAPSNGRYAVAYHTTDDAFDGAETCIEYLVVP